MSENKSLTHDPNVGTGKKKEMKAQKTNNKIPDEKPNTSINQTKPNLANLNL